MLRDAQCRKSGGWVDVESLRGTDSELMAEQRG